MPASRPHIFNIPASAPFLRTLIGALLKGEVVSGFPENSDPLALSRATIYLPTRRACRLARDVFLDSLDGGAAILPRIAAIGDIDEDEIAFSEAATGELAQTALSLPPAIAPLERRLLLAELILKWANAPDVRGAQGATLIANTPSAALGLADDLARLMDDMTTRQVKWEKLDRLVPDELDPYWQLSLNFLKIAREAWPKIRNERGAIESAERRDKLIEAETKRLAASTAPVIAAGSTGSMPATARLLATIATLPHGALVLPGLDMDLDDASWALIAGDDSDKSHDGAPAAGHAQFAMHALLDQLKVKRGDVIQLAPSHGRDMLVSEALRPAATTERWQEHAKKKDFAQAADRALASLAMIEAANPEEEALAIAVALREAADTKGKHAALITPDRGLARRVVAALERWHVAVDDSGGYSLADTNAGVFARVAAEAALGGLEPVTLLALLKHSLLRLSAAPGAYNTAIAALERAILRGPRPKPGVAGPAHALATFRANRGTMHKSDPRWLIAQDELDAAAALIEHLAAALAPLEKLKGGAQPLATLAKLHADVIEALGTDADGKVTAFSGHDGTALARAFEELIESPSAAGLAVAKNDYAELFHATIGERVVRRPEVHDVRIRIFGPLEARLQTIDRVVLGGLNEGTWPPETRSDPWLSRPMRRDLGLDPPERRIGLSAHDFAQSLGAPEAILSRAGKVAGAPTVSSRFVQRIAALAGPRWEGALARGNRYLELARALDHPQEVKPAKRPQPKPPREARPMRLSVTEIEHWLRDPYTIYAKHVLRLLPLDAVDTPPGARDRGTLIHEAIGEFTETFAAKLPADPAAKLLAIGVKHFAQLADYPEARAFWWPRFMRIAGWFAQWENERRANIATLHAEIRGQIEIPLGDAKFTLSARADRIERLTSGAYAILDYKTGRLPGHDEVKVGFAPQLTLEAAILREGGFADIPRGATVAELVYVGLKGGAPEGEIKIVKLKDSTPDAEADNALKKLARNARKYLIDGAPYASLVSPMWIGRRYGDYDHLARVKEWSLIGGAEEGGGE